MADENNSAAIYTLMAAPSVSLADARRIGEELSVNWSVVPVEEFRGPLPRSWSTPMSPMATWR